MYVQEGKEEIQKVGSRSPHIHWDGKRLLLLDQRKLPHEEVFVECHTAEDVAKAIKEMVVRGAPAIGIVAAFGLVLEAKRLGSGEGIRRRIEEALKVLKGTRPTARNLFWALERMEEVIGGEDDPEGLPFRLEEEALRIWQEDLEANIRIAQRGAELLPEGARVLTHCNAGELATGGYGTALGVIKEGYRRGKVKMVFATETRPLLQGARLTAWELWKEGIPVRLVGDSAVGYLMSKGMIDVVIVGADRITSRGDVANKVGTYVIAVLAKRHDIPFFVAAPLSTFDFQLLWGDSIPIEERDQREVLEFMGMRIAPEGVEAFNPAFDLTPAELVTAIITEKEVLWPPL